MFDIHNLTAAVACWAVAAQNHFMQQCTSILNRHVKWQHQSSTYQMSPLLSVTKF